MFNVGGGEVIVILLIALIVLGPDKLPGAARQVGKYLNEFRRISSGFQDEIRSAMDVVNQTPTDLPPADPTPDPTPEPTTGPTGEAASAAEPATPSSASSRPLASSAFDGKTTRSPGRCVKALSPEPE